MGLTGVCLGSINHGIFSEEATSSPLNRYFTYVFCHMKMYLMDRSQCADKYILTHVIGEEYAEFLPTQVKIEGESAARLYFANVVRSALKSIKASNPDFTVCLPVGLTYESYEQNQEFKIGYNCGSNFKKYPNPFKNPSEFRAVVRTLLEFNNKTADIGALFDVAYGIVLMLALMMVPVRVNWPKELLFLTFVTFAKKGLVSVDYINKIELVIKEELHISIKFNEAQIKMLWRNFELHMSPKLMERCVELTLAQLPKESARLRKLVEMCKWHGLTCYQAVKQALSSLPAFPWNGLMTLTEYRTEMEAYKEAEQLVGDNAFYGYNPSMGKAKSIYYKNLASVCAKIMVDTKKSSGLDKAACFTKSYPSKVNVDGIVKEYIYQQKLASIKTAGTVSKQLGKLGQIHPKTQNLIMR